MDLSNLGSKNLGDAGYQPFPSDFYNYIMSNSALISSYPFLKKCKTGNARGAPYIKIPVSTLTESQYNTITSAGIFSPSTAKAISRSKKQPAPGSTANGPAVSTITPAPTKATSSPLVVPKLTQDLHPSVHVSDTPVVPDNTRDVSENESAQSQDKSRSQLQPHRSVNVQSDDSNPPTILQVPALSNVQSSVSTIDQPSQSKPKTRLGGNTSIEKQEPTKFEEALLPTIADEGSTPTHFKSLIGSTSLLNDGVEKQTLVAGGSGITINGVRYSLAHSATAIVSGSSTVALNTETKLLPSLTIGGVVLTANPASNYVFNSQTRIPGASEISTGEVLHSLATSASAIVPGNEHIPLTFDSSDVPGPIVIDGKTYGPSAGDHYVIESQTLAPGAHPITIKGAVYSLLPSATALISNGISVPIPSHKYPLPLAITLGGTTYHEDGASGFVIGSQTLAAGGNLVIVKGAIYSLPPSPTALISNGITIPIPADSFSQPPGIIIGEPAHASKLVIGSQTLLPGAKPITVDGAIYSLAPSATALISNGIAIPIVPHPSPIPTVISIGNIVYPENSASAYLIGSQTLSFNGKPITINATPYSLSLGPSGPALIIGTSTSYLSPPQATRIPAIITIGSSLYTEKQRSDYVIGSQTLSPGSAITVAGTVVSLGPQGTDVVVGTKTEEVGLGSLIIVGFGGLPTASDDSEGFTGGAGGKEMIGGGLLVWRVVGMILIAVRVGMGVLG